MTANVLLIYVFNVYVLQRQHRSVQDRSQFVRRVCMHPVKGVVALKVSKKTAVQ